MYIGKPRDEARMVRPRERRTWERQGTLGFPDVFFLIFGPNWANLDFGPWAGYCNWASRLG
ncbi:hypothetical protein ES319_D05G312000v1 [Gossypium barbadense]|uniref:Uncharacterized protein n=1 Tax=Gossypium barbadense TaxID=3634 RepID=A0A5J5RJS8_GOSBA|nr:hypothetical protein ES319_D05G312000v1 [Gossypium barbadense]